MEHQESYDLIVIGCGAAGLTSALSAAEAASEARAEEFTVAVLERSPKEERGATRGGREPICA